MNKTLSIGLAGFSFIIEEYAYIKLSDYLAALRSSLDNTEADEVMHDIELRMVEIFKESLGKREVINNEDVERVIAQIGTPEAIEEQEEAYYSEANTNKKSYSQRRSYNAQNKQLFRDTENTKLGGVCAGLAHYVGMEIHWMRIIWVAAFFALIPLPGSPFILIVIYGILWAILPQAESTADYLRMQGKPVNFDTIKEESGKIIQFANESTQKVGEMYNESKPVITSAGNGLWNVFRYVFGVFFAFVAFCFLISSFVVFGLFGNPDFPGMSEINFYMDHTGGNAVFTSIVVIASIIPTIIFGLLAIKLFSPKTKLRNIGYVLGALILLLIGLGTYFGISFAKKDMFYTGHKEESQELLIDTTSDTLYIDMKQVTIPENFKGYTNQIYSDKKQVFDKDYIDIDVTRRVDVKTPYLIIKKRAKGYNVPLQVSIPVEVVNNKILVPNYIKYPYDHRFRDHRVDYELVVPQKTVVISLNTDKINTNGDLNNNGIDDNEEDNDDYDDHGNYNNQSNSNVQYENNGKIVINGNTIEYSSDDKDSVIINGKKYPKKDANKVMKESTDLNMEDIKNIDLKIKDGTKEISIKTGK